jgi:3'-phosphoadenosine 5'-phosphosulfate sulfotransferase (PAPS reductase)/FAD synthetase
LECLVGFSGGIDSQAAALLVRRHYDPSKIRLLNTRAGRNEHSITDNWIKWYSENVFPVTEITPLYRDIWDAAQERHCEENGVKPDDELTFLGLAKLKGRFPSKRMQFCTEHLKIRPQRRWIAENVTDDYELYSGVRSDEPGRSKAALRYWDSFFDCWVNNIVLDWKKEWCFQLVKEAGETYNPLYELGFDRVGCNDRGCINGKSKDVILLNWDRFGTEWRDKIHAWEQETGWTYYAPMVPGMTMNFIDDVIKWAQTDRGGRQPNMFKILAEREPCESKYGLCE